MQPIKQLEQVLASLASPERYLFMRSDLVGAFPGYGGLTLLLFRAERLGLLKRVCRGVYLYPRVAYPRGVVLFHVAARLRAGDFNYISLETALSEAGVISQIPISTVTLMSSGRTQTIRCGEFGRLEFIHTARRPEQLVDQLTYDPVCRLWRASVSLALRDMRATRRSLELISEEAIHELV